MKISQCFRCKHRWETPGPVLQCAAFPDGVPKAIRLQEHDHREPYPGDRDIRFEWAADYKASLAAAKKPT